MHPYPGSRPILIFKLINGGLNATSVNNSKTTCAGPICKPGRIQLQRKEKLTTNFIQFQPDPRPTLNVSLLRFKEILGKCKKRHEKRCLNFTPQPTPHPQNDTCLVFPSFFVFNFHLRLNCKIINCLRISLSRHQTFTLQTLKHILKQFCLCIWQNKMQNRMQDPNFFYFWDTNLLS